MCYISTLHSLPLSQLQYTISLYNVNSLYAKGGQGLSRVVRWGNVRRFVPGTNKHPVPFPDGTGTNIDGEYSLIKFGHPAITVE